MHSSGWEGEGVLRFAAFTVGRDSRREALVNLRYPLCRVCLQAFYCIAGVDSLSNIED